MSTQVERLEHNMVKLTVEVPAEDFAKAITNAYLKNRSKISLPGFRKGKAPQALIEKMYGPEIFFEDAINECISATYGDAADETGLEITSRAEFDAVQAEKGKSLIYTATVAVRPEVKLGEYKGLEIKKADTEVTEEEIQAEIDKQREQNARMIDVDDRAVAQGDEITLDYAGTVDGVAFDGGTAEDHILKIGSGSFIPGFEDQLVGVGIGEEKDVEVTFPEKYHAEDLAGKAAVFHCKVKRIQTVVLPELDDDFAQDVSEFDTLAEYKEDLKKKLSERKEQAAKTDRENDAVARLIAASEIDVPEAMINSQAQQMLMQYARQLQSQGISYEAFSKYQEQNGTSMLELMKPQAENQIRTRLVLEEVAKAENIEISDERVNDELKKMAETYKIDAEEMLAVATDLEKAQIKTDLAVQEAVTVLVENAKEVEE